MKEKRRLSKALDRNRELKMENTFKLSTSQKMTPILIFDYLTHSYSLISIVFCFVLFIASIPYLFMDTNKLSTLYKF